MTELPPSNVPSDAEPDPRDLLRAGLESAADETGSAPLPPTVPIQGMGSTDEESIEAVARDFPQFEFQGVLGRGGMGVVYKVRQTSLDRVVALKVVSSRVVAKLPSFRERFAREARALARLTHQNIVTVYDFGETNGRLFLLMEYVEGTNLRQVLNARAMKPAEALGIVPFLCDALEYAHSENIVHRDIKPENILIDKRGRVKIADFGLAKLIRSDGEATRITESGAVMGTYHYMAPEQLARPAEVDQRVDVYALGVVLYEMLTGELPVGRFEVPSKKVAVDVRLDDVVLRALEREPDRRYQHASEVKTDLEAMSRQAASPPPPPPPGVGAAAEAGAPRCSRLAVAAFLCLFPAPAIILAAPAPAHQFWYVAAWLFGFAAVAAGWIARWRILRSNGRLTGLGYALAGAWIPLLLVLFAMLVTPFARSRKANAIQAIQASHMALIDSGEMAGTRLDPLLPLHTPVFYSMWSGAEGEGQFPPIGEGAIQQGPVVVATSNVADPRYRREVKVAYLGRRYHLATDFAVDLYRLTIKQTGVDGAVHSTGTTLVEYQGRPTKLSSSLGFEMLLGPTADSVHLSMAMARAQDSADAPADSPAQVDQQTPDSAAASAPQPPAEAPTEDQLSDACRQAVAEGRLEDALEFEGRRALLRLERNNPWADKVHLLGMAGEWAEAAKPSPERMAEASLALEARRAGMAATDPLAWRYDAVLAELAWLQGAGAQALQHIENAMADYPFTVYDAPQNGSVFHHLANIRAGYQWEMEGLETAQRETLQLLELDARMHLVFLPWWEQAFADHASTQEEQEAFKQALTAAYAVRAERFPAEAEYIQRISGEQ